MLQFVSNEQDPHHTPPSTTPPLNSYHEVPHTGTNNGHHSYPFRASNYTHDNKRHLLLAASGSVATIKIFPIITTLLSSHPDKLSIRLILTPAATTFLGGQSDEQPSLASISQIPGVDGIYLDSSEWNQPWRRGDPILHIELRRWSDLMVIAPLSADMLARIVGGMADGLLASVVRAWDTTGEVDGVRSFGSGTGTNTNKKRKRIVVAPAMNTAMYNQPITALQVRVLEKEWGVGNEENGGEGWFEVLRPQEKELACGTFGVGAMRDWKEIVNVIEERLDLGAGEGV